jgi:hypothetical protein
MSKVGIMMSLENVILILPLELNFPKFTVAGGNSFTVALNVAMAVVRVPVETPVTFFGVSCFTENKIKIWTGGSVLGS